MTSRTSINGMKLISGSSRPREPLRSMAARALLALAVREVDELDGLLLHLDDQLVDLAAEMPVEDQRKRVDRRDDQRPDGPARCLDHGPHVRFLLGEKWWTVACDHRRMQPAPLIGLPSVLTRASDAAPRPASR